ncbi:MAG: hypothetical protein RLZZ262_2253 [Bacteroidota bacterium]|jgi:hypothetical protein
MCDYVLDDVSLTMEQSQSERSYKAFGAWALGGVNTALSLLKVLIKSKRPPAIPAIESTTCFVLGNGPSMKESLRKHSDRFLTGDVMCVNSFALSAEFVALKPKHYVIIDPGLWFDGNVLAHQTFEAMANNCDWAMNLFVPHTARGSKPLQLLMERNAKVNVCFINYVVFKGWASFAHTMYDKRRAMPQSQNVMVAALFWAVNVGYKKIELFGVDHNWHTQLEVDENNVVCTRHEHFYSKEGQVKLVPFYKLASTKETFRMDEIFHAWAKVFAGYRAIRQYADGKNCQIINASEISFVDAFERKKI